MRHTKKINLISGTVAAQRRRGAVALDLRDGFCGELRAPARDEAHLAFRVRARRNGAVGGLGRVDQRLGGVDRWFLGLRTLAGEIATRWVGFSLRRK